jgi:gamma-glutamyltranspeptidase/glutathione hydrolase
MIWFNPKPGTKNSIEPYKRPLVNMGPIIACKNGKPYASIGSPGGRKIHNANINVALNILEFGMGPQKALSTSRTDASGSTTLADYRIDDSVINALNKMGHKIQMVGDSETWYSFARPSAIVFDQEKNLLKGGSDPFLVAEAKGY